MIRILFDGPPSHESGRFVEVENEKGESIKLGEWVQDGEYWVLQFPDCREINNELLDALRTIASGTSDIIPPCRYFSVEEAMRIAKQAIVRATMREIRK